MEQTGAGLELDVPNDDNGDGEGDGEEGKEIDEAGDKCGLIAWGAASAPGELGSICTFWGTCLA